LGLERSIDGGQSFSSILGGTDVYHVAASADGQVIFAGVIQMGGMGATGGVRQSLDSGTTFQDISQGLGSDVRADVRWVVVHPSDPTRAVIATIGMGVLIYEP
jgi:hypothetical protein